MAITPSRAALDDFETVVRTEQRRVYRVLLAMLRDPDAADDLTQECFLRAYEHWHRFRGDCSARTWLLRIAINLVRDHAKNRRWQFWRALFQQPATADLKTMIDPLASPERTALARAELAEVWSTVASLSSQQRAVFVLRFVEDMSLEEIAAATSLRPGTVKSHLFRATDAIRKRMEEGQKR
jgi:RNA polymerase sigma-70 factor (ECF subfamily)